MATGDSGHLPTARARASDSPQALTTTTRWATWLAGAVCGGALGTAAASGAAAPHQPTREPLVPGVAIERAIAVGADQVFALDVAGGSAVLVTVDQDGADVRLTVAPAAGSPMVADEADRGTAGRELLVWAVPADGVVAITLSASRTSDAGGRYTLRAARLDPVDGLPGAIDAFNAAATVTRGGTPADAADQLRALTAALEVWRRLGQRDLEGQTLVRLGLVQVHRAGRPLDAARSFADAAAVFEALRHEADLADAEVQQALAQRQAGQTQDAFHTGQRAYARAGRVSPRLRARMESELSSTAAELGDSELGLRYARQSVTTSRELGERGALIIALERVADHTLRMRQLDESLAAIDEAVALADASGAPPTRRGALLRTLGRIHGAAGDSEQAIVAFRRAAELTSQETDRLVLDLDVSRHLNRLGDHAAARDLLEAALARLPAQERNVRAAIGAELGASLAKLGDLDRARTLQEAAFAFVETGGSSRNQVIVLRDLLSTVRAQGDRAAARTLTARLVAASATLPPGEAKAVMLKEQARTARLLDDLAAAEAFAREAIEASDSSRARLRGEALRTAYGGNTAIYLEEAIDVVMARHAAEPAAGHDGRALVLFEQSRARALTDLLAGARVDVRAGLEPALIDKATELQRQVAVADAAIRAAGTGAAARPRVAALEAEIDGFARELAVIDARARETSPRYRAATGPPLASLADMQALLDDDTVLLAFACGELGDHGWALTRSGVDAFALPPLPELTAAARRVIEVMRQPGAASAADAEAAGTALGRLVLGPIADRLRQQWRGRRLAIVASGPLEYVPFAALAVPDGAPGAPPQWLAASHEIVVLPSASVLSLLREAGSRRAPTRELVVLADPVYSPTDPRVAMRLTSAAPRTGVTRAAAPLAGSRGDFARLVFSRQEAKALTQLAGSAKAIQVVDFDARLGMVGGADVAGARRLHFATHGILDAVRPERSGLVLSLVDRQGRPQDGILRLNDIFRLQLSAELVVLSGCETGLGRQLRGEGLVGLTRAFMYAGAPRVVSSLWQVDDQATATLMTRFYQHMLRRGARPAAALRAAQLELAADPRWASPYFWAGFVLHGDWR
jgi:CHAT domain-containing protein/tetratricopeptide (TPR) repeat protein